MLSILATVKTRLEVYSLGSDVIIPNSTMSLFSAMSYIFLLVSLIDLSISPPPKHDILFHEQTARKHRRDQTRHPEITGL